MVVDYTCADLPAKAEFCMRISPKFSERAVINRVLDAEAVNEPLEKRGSWERRLLSEPFSDAERDGRRNYLYVHHLD